MLVFFSDLMLILLLVIVVLLTIIILTTIKVNFKYIDKNYKVIIKLYFLSKIKYLNIEIDKSKLKKMYKKTKTKIEEFNHKKIEKELYQDRKIIKNIIKKLKIDLEYLDLDLKIGTEFILLTSVIIVTISTIFPMVANRFIRKYEKRKYNYKFTPIYNKNDINLKLDCIISTKMVHIINVIISIIFKKGVFKNVRTSNTRFNDNCYE